MCLFGSQLSKVVRVLEFGIMADLDLAKKERSPATHSYAPETLWMGKCQGNSLKLQLKKNEEGKKNHLFLLLKR